MKKLRFDSPLILGYAILSGLALLGNVLSGGWANRMLFSVYRSSFRDVLTWVRLFGHVIGHVSLAHYAGNFMMILLLGPALERRYGWKMLLLFMAGTALLTGLVQMIFSSAALLGASGIVFMMIVLTACSGLRDGGIPITLLLVVVLYLGEQLVTGLTVQDSVSQLGHILGGLCGLGFGVAFTPRKSRN